MRPMRVESGRLDTKLHDASNVGSRFVELAVEVKEIHGWKLDKTIRVRVSVRDCF